MSRMATRIGLAVLLPAVLGAIACGSAAATPRKAGSPTPTPSAAHGTPAPRSSPIPRAAHSTPVPSKVPGTGVPPTGGAPEPSVTAAALPVPAATDPPEPLATVAPLASVARPTVAPISASPPATASIPGQAPATDPAPPALGSATATPPPLGVRTVAPPGGQPPSGGTAAGGAPSAPTTSAAPPRAAGAASAEAGRPASATPPAPGAAQAGASLQDLFQAVSVKELDLPLGFRETLASTKPPLYLGQEASFYAHFTRPAQAGGASPAAVGVVLLAFPDDVTAAARMRSGRAQVNSYLTSGGGQHVEQATGPTLGDESLSLHLLRTSDGIGKSDGGYEVIWRRGRMVIVVMETGNPEPASIADVAAIAQQQDQNLADAGL